MTVGVKFCAFLTTRYLNSKLKDPAHDWVAANVPELPQGLIKLSQLKWVSAITANLL
jgi:hypothetical protein